VVKHLFALKPIITTLFHNKDNLIASVVKGILQTIAKAMIFIGKAMKIIETNNNNSVS